MVLEPKKYIKKCKVFYGYLLITLHFANNKYVHPIDYKCILCFSANPIYQPLHNPHSLPGLF